MRGIELLDKMGLINFAFVEDADKTQAENADRVGARKSRGRIGLAAAVCFCLIAAGIFSVWEYNAARRPAPDLEKLSIPELTSGGMGFEGYMYYNASELDNDNPWNENMNIEKLPVYKNKAYDPYDAAGVPQGMSEEEMRSLVDSAASALGVEVLSVERISDGRDGSVRVPAALDAATNNGRIYVRANGSVTYTLPDGGLELPEGYSLGSDTADGEAKETIACLSSLYRDFLHMEVPEPVTWGDYNIYGEYNRRYEVYDSGGNDIEDILNYNLCMAGFSFTEAGALFTVHINNGLMPAEKVGDYPVVSALEARQRLLSGKYQTSVPYAMPGEEYIAKVELVYRTGRLEEMLMPYYRFYVLLPDMERDDGLKTYGAYYVPAVADEYVDNMPVYDGHFN